jgi:hypothetical protein
VFEIRRIASRPWDFTLFESNDGSYILEVTFSEGEYKIDVGRFFRINHLIAMDRTPMALSDLAAQIRADYPCVPYSQIRKSDLQIIE